MPVPRWVVPLFVVFAVGLVPWIAWLAISLPTHSVVAHYRLTWVGFDVFLLAALVLTGLAAQRRSTLLEVAETATATLLAMDAWFDTTSAATKGDLAQAVFTAVVFELPIAALCLWIARHAEAVRRRGEHESDPRADTLSGPGGSGLASPR